MNEIFVVFHKPVDPKSPFAGFGNTVAFDARSLPFAPQVGDTITSYGKRHKVLSVEWDFDSGDKATVHVHCLEVTEEPGDNSGDNSGTVGTNAH